MTQQMSNLSQWTQPLQDGVRISPQMSYEMKTARGAFNTVVQSNQITNLHSGDMPGPGLISYRLNWISLGPNSWMCLWKLIFNFFKHIIANRDLKMVARLDGVGRTQGPVGPRTP